MTLDDPASRETFERAQGLHKEGALAEAERLYGKVLADHPGNASVLHMLGLIAHQRGRDDEAINLIEEAVAAVDGPPPEAFLTNLGAVHNNLANALADLGRHAAAAGHYSKALEANPKMAEAHSNLGRLLGEQGRMEEAEEHFRRALELAPDYADAANNLGGALAERGRTEDAIAAFSRALDINPALNGARSNLGGLLAGKGNYGEAAAHYRRILKDNSADGGAAAQLFHIFQRTCDWRAAGGLAPALDALTVAALEKGWKPGETPFFSIARTPDPEMNRRIADAWSSDLESRLAPLRDELDFHFDKPGDGPVTLGYLSGNFYDHPTAHNTRGIYGLHDRDRFRVIAYSAGPIDGGEYRTDIAGACDAFVDVRDLPAGEAARRIHEDGVDVLIGLTGHTSGSRLDICALRPAPVQVAWLSFPGTCGGGIFDYIITDLVVAPQCEQAFYSEAPIYMPRTYWPTDNGLAISDKPARRADNGLPEHGVVFAALNQTYKIGPDIFSVWMEILKECPGGVLWLFRGNAQAEENLKNEAAARGVDSSRLVFADKMPKADHLARLRLADLALDTDVYGGHTTTTDALWAGVPVLTIKGSHWASRASESILRAADMADMVAESSEGYRRLAVELGGDGEKLAALRVRAKETRSSALFDTPAFVGHLERGLSTLWDRYRAGEAPAPLTVAGDKEQEMTDERR